MKKLVYKVNILKKSKIKKIIDGKIKEFYILGKKPINNIFKELCFCILTANFQAEKSIFIQKKINSGFLTLTKKQLASKLKKLGHRFPNMRAKYIVEARQHKNELKKVLDTNNNKFKTNNNEETKEINEKTKREWIVKNIKGLGMKESSHFLRNIGYNNVAILDFHVIDLLVENKIISRTKTSTGKATKTLSQKKYLEIEKELSKLCKKTKLTQAQLDLYLWYIETGKVLK
ncbi:N-glycosylase/DNA lyase [Candidatus Woesearchaeota archaeon]|jgi:N-glycosylase/DNA lyase|nr:N-glycosylase/DNA lyase [Candidatus Woesearchaeota archaeon]